MKNEDKREGKRYDSINLLNYVCFDSEGQYVSQGVARTLNISETGVKVETHEPIETRHIMVLSVGIGDDLCDIKGKVVYCNRGAEGRFESGIEFHKIGVDDYLKLLRYIDAFEKNV